MEHPGKYIRQQIEWRFGGNCSLAAREMCISKGALWQTMVGRRKVNLESAKVFAYYFGPSVEFWLDLQKKYDNKDKV